MNEVLQVLSLLFFFTAGLLIITFPVRIITSLFSQETCDQIRRNPRLHALWGILAFGSFLFLYVFSSGAWPPRWFERKQQRAQVLERVNAAGGWDVLRNECVDLMKAHQTNGFFWFHRNDTNIASSTLLALKPQEVRFEPYDSRNSNNLVVEIKIFGMHSTGGHSTPAYWIFVLCNTNADTTSYVPSIVQSDAGYPYGHPRHHYRQITNNIFEIY